jgi:hypothetical protein
MIVHVLTVCSYKDGVYTNETYMTELTRVHAIIERLDDGVVILDPCAGMNVTRVLCVVMDQIMSRLNLHTVGMLAQTCSSLRIMTTDVHLLDYILHLIPGKNSEDTRRVFQIPRSIPLSRISRGLYSQAYSFHSAIQKYGGMNAFRDAVDSRRLVTRKRREITRARMTIAQALRDRREKLVTDAVLVLRLPPASRFHPSASLFINNVPPVMVHQEEVRLAFVIDRVCWMHYLVTYTDFTDKYEALQDVMGEYPGILRDVMDQFARPDVWPWLV